jgi:hypothetical protein
MRQPVIVGAGSPRRPIKPRPPLEQFWPEASERPRLAAPDFGAVVIVFVIVKLARLPSRHCHAEAPPATGLEPKPKKDWRAAARRRLPKQAGEYFEQFRELLKAAKGLK